MNRKTVAGFPLILSAALFALPRPAAAADLRPFRITVGTGTPESCTEFALQDGLTTARVIGGGTIKFRCGAAPFTIVVTVQSWVEDGYVTLNLPHNTTVDGEGLITLTNGFNEAGFPASVIFVDSGVTAVLKNLALHLGGISYSSGLSNAGTLTLQSVSLSCPAGYCIRNGGKLDVRGSTLSRSPLGGGLFLYGLVNASTGSVVAKNTVFSDNYGIAFWNDGAATVDASSFLRNSNDSFSTGAALYNAGTVTVTGTQFSSNISGTGSAVLNFGTLVLKGSTLSGNAASFIGGALSNSGQATIDNSRFVGNEVTGHHGGGAVFNSGALTVKNTDFSSNLAGSLSNPAYGGALYNASTGTLTVKSSTLSGNTADYGGAIANGGLASFFTDNSPNGGVLKIVGTSVITNNTAIQQGGGVYSYGTGTAQIDPSTQVVNNTPDDIFP